MENKSVDYGVIEELKSIWSNTFPQGIHTQPILRLFSVICESILPLSLFFFLFYPKLSESHFTLNPAVSFYRVFMFEFKMLALTIDPSTVGPWEKEVD